MSEDYKAVRSGKKKEAEELMTTEQFTACNIAIHTASVAAGVAGAIPIPVADALPISGAQITMAIALGKVFDQQLSETAAKALISAAASTFVGRQLVKIVPIAGSIVSAGVAAGVTEAIGWTLAVDFANKSLSLKNQIDDNTDKEKVEESVADNQELKLIEEAKTYIKVSDKNEQYEELLDKIKDYIQKYKLAEDSELWSEYVRLLRL